MANWLIPLTHLTPAQVEAVQAPTRKHRIILGPPGSGKTQVMLHRAPPLHQLGLPRAYLMTYNRTLSRYLQDAVDFLGLNPEAVGTSDQLFKQLYEQHLSRRLPWDKEAKTPDFARIQAELLAAAQAGRLPAPLYDFVLVDEAQDLSVTALHLIGVLARHVTVFMDGKQRLYTQGVTEAEVVAALGVTERRTHLLEAYRVSPHVAALASTFIADPAEQKLFLRQVRTEQTERQTPVLFLAQDAAQETARVTAAVASRVQQGERVAVLFPTRRQVRGYSNAFREAGIPVEVSHPLPGMQELDFRSDQPKLMTYQAAKGMTFDAVVLPRLTPRSFAHMPAAQMLFVGTTRATRWALLSTVEGQMLPDLTPLLTPSTAWTVQRQEHLADVNSSETPDEEGEDLFY